MFKTKDLPFGAHQSRPAEKRYFTVEEANSMIPFLEKAFTRIIQLRNQIRVLYKRLDRYGYAPKSDMFPVNVPDADPHVIADRGTLKAMIETLREELDTVRSTGVLIKGLDSGLVDWYAQKDGRDIFLCWQMGEDHVTHWHAIDAGFSGRRPISELEEVDAPPKEQAN